MLPIDRLSVEEARGIDVLLFDLDDTVLSHGQLTRVAYDAIWRLSEHLTLVAVTGRPAGWGEIIARQWPVRGVVAENGAAILERRGNGIERTAADSKRMLTPLIADIRRAFPEIDLADDNALRLTDVTFDIGERATIPAARVEQLRDYVQSRGARAIVSSVHLHATFEGDDKASGVLRMLRAHGCDAGRARARAAFVGDSENDAACFAAFRTTIGVANIARFLPRLSVPPRFITQKAMGEGFAELADALISRRT